MAAKTARDLYTIEFTPEVRAAFDRLCAAEARSTGGNPARVGATVLRRLVLEAARKIRKSGRDSP